MPRHLSTGIEKQMYYQIKPTFNFVYSRNNFPQNKRWDICNNVDQFKSRGIHWIAFYVNGYNGGSYYNKIYIDRNTFVYKFMFS